MSILKSWFRLASLALCVVCVSTLPGAAAGIKYQLMIPNATVQLGAQSYTNVQVMFTFVGDDSNVFSGTIPDPALPAVLTYSAIYQGVASVTIISSGGNVLASAVFDPNQIVVSVDHRNQGVGFGFVPGGIGAST